jgi:hypothetical protein
VDRTLLRLLARVSVAALAAAPVLSASADPDKSNAKGDDKPAAPADHHGPKKPPSRESVQGDLGTPRVAIGVKRPPPKPELPVSLTVIANSPDPPWTVRVENTGDHVIRIAADVRLLSFDLETAQTNGHGGGKVHCAAPRGLAPSTFPKDRELYLQPGESYVADFDPRLFCFGGGVDALTAGTMVHPHYGFSSPPWAKQVFAAEGIDRPHDFAPRAQIDGPSMLLAYHPGAPPPQPGALQPGALQPGAPQPGAARGPQAGAPQAGVPEAGAPQAGGWARPEAGHPGDAPALAAAWHDKSAGCRHDQPGAGGPLDPACNQLPPEGPTFTDLNAAKVDVYVDRTIDAGAARDLVLNVHVKNDGTHDLTTALRGAMLTFTVEELGPDNQARNVVECGGSEHPHPIAAEMLYKMRGGRTVAVPQLLGELCPGGTFDRPGLYRVRPRLDTTAIGEAAELGAHIGQALARQTTLVRLATAKSAFDDQPPRAVPTAPPGAVPASAPASARAPSTPASPSASDPASCGPVAPGVDEQSSAPEKR